MAYVNFPTYLETRSQGYGELPQRPVVVAAPKADDTSKTLLFLGIGLALGYMLLGSKKEKSEKNPHEYIPITSFGALMREFGRSVDNAKDGADGDKLLKKAIEKVRVKNPDDPNKIAYGFMTFDEFKENAKTDPLLKGMEDDEELLKTIHEKAVKSRVDLSHLVENPDDDKKEKNPSPADLGGGSQLVIIKKVAKNRYYGIFKKVEHQHKRGRIVTKKTYSVELLDHKDRPIDDPTNRFWLTSLPKAKAYVKELKGAV